MMKRLKKWWKTNVNLNSFWRVLPLLFTLDFWRINRNLLSRRGYKYYAELDEIKKWAKKHGYYTSDGWYLDGEKYLFKNGIKLCMIQPLYYDKLTRLYAWQPNGKEGTHFDHTFLLNKHKTARALFKCLNEESNALFERDRLCDKINQRIAAKDKKYLKSDEFLHDLAHLSRWNYYDILDLKNNTIYTNKEKKQFLGDYCDYEPIFLSDYLSFEEAEIKEATGEEFDWNWTADFIPTALTRGSIDSVLCINPSKIHGLKVTPELLKRMHNLFFKGI